MIVLLMGVAGAGKTVVGRALAGALAAEFHDADDLHPAENVARMRAGLPLGDAERGPWLDRVAALLADLAARRAAGVVACSALRARYRDRLLPPAVAPHVRLVYLRVRPGTAEARVAARAAAGGHFMPPSLVETQFAALEPPEPGDAAAVDAERPVDEVVRAIVDALGPRD